MQIKRWEKLVQKKSLLEKQIQQQKVKEKEEKLTAKRSP